MIGRERLLMFALKGISLSQTEVFVGFFDSLRFLIWPEALLVMETGVSDSYFLPLATPVEAQSEPLRR